MIFVSFADHQTVFLFSSDNDVCEEGFRASFFLFSFLFFRNKSGEDESLTDMAPVVPPAK